MKLKPYKIRFKIVWHFKATLTNTWLIVTPTFYYTATITSWNGKQKQRIKYKTFQNILLRVQNPLIKLDAGSLFYPGSDLREFAVDAIGPWGGTAIAEGDQAEETVVGCRWATGVALESLGL